MVVLSLAGKDGHPKSNPHPFSKEADPMHHTLSTPKNIRPGTHSSQIPPYPDSTTDKSNYYPFLNTLAKKRTVPSVSTI